MAGVPKALDQRKELARLYKRTLDQSNPEKSRETWLEYCYRHFMSRREFERFKSRPRYSLRMTPARLAQHYMLSIAKTCGARGVSVAEVRDKYREARDLIIDLFGVAIPDNPDAANLYVIALVDQEELAAESGGGAPNDICLWNGDIRLVLTAKGADRLKVERERQEHLPKLGRALERLRAR